MREATTWHRGELLYRVGLPIVALVLAVLAIPLAYVNPRVGSAANLIVAVLVFLLYHSLMSVVQARVQQGRTSFEVGVWVTHALFLGAAVFMLVRRGRPQGWLRWRRRARAPAAEATA